MAGTAARSSMESKLSRVSDTAPDCSTCAPANEGRAQPIPPGSAAAGLADTKKTDKLNRDTHRERASMEVIAGIAFATLLILISFAVNRRILGGRLVIDIYRLALTASSVLLLAVVAESVINPLYAMWVGNKLWEYRAFPLHDANVSALAVIVWTLVSGFVSMMTGRL